MGAAVDASAPSYWRRVGAPPPLEAGVAHVWRMPLADDAHALALRQLLSVDERARADRFYAQAHRTRWTVAHGWLRQILSWYGGVSPHALTLETGEFGKPRLATTDIEFNLSHSGDLALVAVTRGGPVGVDVEQWDPGIDHVALAEQFFSPVERSSLRSLGGDYAVLAGFFAAWTRKEAYLKATGHGVARGLHHFDVTLTPGEPARLLADRFDADAGHRWTMVQLDVAPGYSGALVAPAPLRAVELFDVPDIPVARS